MQYLFLNGRHIRDHSLQHALGEAYRGLLMVGRFPIAFLSIEMPPDMVDVNVHPTKLEVRFQDSGRLYSQLLSTLRSKFLTSDLSTRVETPGVEDPSGGHDDARASQLRQDLVDWAKGKVASWQPPGGATAAPQQAGDATWPPAAEPPRQFAFPADAPQEHRPLELTRLGFGQPRAAGPAASPPEAEPRAPEGAMPDGPLGGRSPQALQIHNRYLVTETQDGVTIIDQHALHERILFEQLRARIDAGAMETQNLLVPEPVDLSHAESAVVLENREVLAKLGMRIEPFGGDTVLIVGFPAMLANMNPVETLHVLLERLVTGGGEPDRRDLLDDLLHTVACKAAIKAGDRLTPVEITALLEQQHLVDDAHHCPHGRPTALVFTREELDKQFKRI
jgi:DNA mismatch repair protein MutL